MSASRRYGRLPPDQRRLGQCLRLGIGWLWPIHASRLVHLIAQPLEQQSDCREFKCLLFGQIDIAHAIDPIAFDIQPRRSGGRNIVGVDGGKIRSSARRYSAEL